MEAAAGYRGCCHGEAVAWGMLFALRLAARRGLAADRRRAARAPCSARSACRRCRRSTPSACSPLFARDKKARETGVGWVLPQDLGRGRWNVKVPADEVAAELAAFLADAEP